MLYFIVMSELAEIIFSVLTLSRLHHLLCVISRASGKSTSKVLIFPTFLYSTSPI